MLRTILVTGDAGYICSHTVLQLLQQGFRVVVVDNLNNASEVALIRVAELAGHNSGNLVFHKMLMPWLKLNWRREKLMMQASEDNFLLWVRRKMQSSY